MKKFLRRAWDFDLLLWLAKRHGREYEHCYVFCRWRQVAAPDPEPLWCNPDAEDMYARRRQRDAAPKDDKPADQWRDYGPAEPEAR